MSSKGVNLNTGDDKSLKIGCWHDASFNGTIDDVRIYQSALTSDHVQWLYNDGKGLSYPNITDRGLTSSLVSYWHLDAGGLPSNAIGRDSHGTNNLSAASGINAAEGPDSSNRGDDRFFTFRDSLTGENKASIERYIK